MKKLALIMALVLSATTLMASEREFRVNRWNLSDRGYAVAWGVPGKTIDFEALDKKSEEEIMNFIDNENIVNYVVDLETNKILMTVENDFAEFTIAGQHYGNHYSVQLARVDLKDMHYDAEALLVFTNYKWSNSISNLLIINRGKADVVVDLNLGEGKFNKTLLDVVRKGLVKTEEIEMFDRGAISIGVEEVDMYGNINFQITAEIPKSDEAYLTINATVLVSAENNVIEVKLVKLTSKME